MHNIVLRHEVYMICKMHTVLEIRYIIFKMDISAGDDLYLNIDCVGVFSQSIGSRWHLSVFSDDLSSI